MHALNNDAAPLPDEWTPNHGDTYRALRTGMEIRFPDGRQAHVLRTSSFGALVTGLPRRVTLPDGSSFESKGNPITICLHSDVDYRRAGKRSNS